MRVGSVAGEEGGSGFWSTSLLVGARHLLEIVNAPCQLLSSVRSKYSINHA